MEALMKKLFITCLTLCAISACSTSSTGRNQVALYSDSELNTMGESSFEQMKKDIPISGNKSVNNFVNCVANAITKHVPKSAHEGDWEVVVFDSAQVNAFALPGGKIGVYTGILNVTEDQHQLAAIIGHEVGHVVESHSNERLSANKISDVGMMVANLALGASEVENKNLWMAGLGAGVQYGLIMPYSRSHESEADVIGQELMARAGFEPKASVKLWQNMSKLSKNSPPEFMSTHPANDTRIKQLTQHLSVSSPLYSEQQRQGLIHECVKPAVIPAPPVKKSV